MKKHFLYCFAILTGLYLCGTLLYYSQIYLLYDYFDNNVISSVISGWAYVAQGIGILFFILLYKKREKLPGRSIFQVIVSLLLIPICCLFILYHNQYVLLSMAICLNIIIGLQTAFAFYLISKYVETGRRALCFALSYAVGGIGTWIISMINGKIMTTYRIFFLAFTIFALVDVCIIRYEKYVSIDKQTENVLSKNIEEQSHFSLKYMIIILVLMAIITAFGSNDPILVERGIEISFLTTRLFYACGLILAAIIFDYDESYGAICTMASLMYPLVVIILYQEIPSNMIVVGLTDTFAGFYVVYRAGVFMNHSDKSLASIGLLITRITEGFIIILIHMLGLNHLYLFLGSAIIFVPLIFIFGISMQRENGDGDKVKNAPGKTETEIIEGKMNSQENNHEEKKIFFEEKTFAEINHLTRREEEILNYLVRGKTNKEIASDLCLSESTIRFHVSNILKKTGYENRNKLRQAYVRIYSK